MAARATNTSFLQRLAQQLRSKMPRAKRLLAFPTRPAINEELMLRVEELARQRTTPLSLLDLYRFGNHPSPAQRLRNAQFLHFELPRRIAQRVIELRDRLPPGLAEKRGIQNVMGWYAGYVEELQAFPKPMDSEQEYDFTCLLASILCDHTSIPRALAHGIQEYRADMSYEDLLLDPDRESIEQTLTGFYTARIGLRFLVEHHIVSNDAREGYSGIIASHCSPRQVATAAAADAERLCRAALGNAPTVRTIGTDKDDFCYVPSHLYYMIVETLKNSCRAVVEKHDPIYRAAALEVSPSTLLDQRIRLEARQKAFARATPTELPPVKVIVAMGEEDVTIKVADEGGGVPRSDLRLLWTFFYTTFPPSFPSSPAPLPGGRAGGGSLDENVTVTNPAGNVSAGPFTFPNVGTEPVLAGHGMGLPLSRIYARYFGGDLEVKSLEGFGMDSYLHLCKLGDKCEDIGLQVMRSPAGRDSTPTETS
ncbi:mitochondrial pyruvate dehydrogenase kinase [Nannochloropsis gaditana]|uniref:Protein-serine/threonine kinase n=1 Tax=Nannochloropsis gaditana TaxID=72520 RepID=W7TRD2_9STRA|nr:mitochondrial pyruvate dehydrogenase kinase [Nannochloropsis gaditana]